MALSIVKGRHEALKGREVGLMGLKRPPKDGRGGKRETKNPHSDGRSREKKGTSFARASKNFLDSRSRLSQNASFALDNHSALSLHLHGRMIVKSNT